jgi:uncharacterized protein (TIGR02145 family)
MPAVEPVAAAPLAALPVAAPLSTEKIYQSFQKNLPGKNYAAVAAAACVAVVALAAFVGYRIMTNGIADKFASLPTRVVTNTSTVAATPAPQQQQKIVYIQGSQTVKYVQGPAGAQGARGAQGPQGPAGANGTTTVIAQNSPTSQVGTYNPANGLIASPYAPIASDANVPVSLNSGPQIVFSSGQGSFNSVTTSNLSAGSASLQSANISTLSTGSASVSGAATFSGPVTFTGSTNFGSTGLQLISPTAPQLTAGYDTSDTWQSSTASTGATTFTFTGSAPSATFKPSADGTSAVTFANAAGAPVLQVDTQDSALTGGAATTIGLAAQPFSNAYFGNVTLGSTLAPDANAAIVFQRGAGNTNAQLQWNAGAGDLRYFSVNYPVNATYTVDSSSISTTANLYSGMLTNNATTGTQNLLSLTNAGTGTTANGIYVNNTGTGTTALQIAGTWTNGIVTNNNSINAGTGALTAGSANLANVTASGNVSLSATSPVIDSPNGTLSINTVTNQPVTFGTGAVTANGQVAVNESAVAGNGQTSHGVTLNITDSTTGGGAYTGLAVKATGSGTGTGSKSLLDLVPNNTSNEVVFDSTGSLHPTAPLSSTTASVGSPSNYFKNGYFDTVTANNIAGTVVSGSTSSTSWTIGSTQAGDTNEAVIFQRDSGASNATLQWNSGSGDQRYFGVNYPFNATYTVSPASISQTANLYSGTLTNNATSGTQRLLSLTNSGTGTTANGIYVNNTGTGTTGLEIAGTWTNGILTDNNSINAGSGSITTTGALSAGSLNAANITVSGLTANAFVYSGAGGAITATTAPTNGQILIGSTGSAPVAAALNTGNNILITNGAGSITVATVNNPVFSTSVTSPLVLGATTANGTLTLEGNSATSGNTATNAAISLNVGNSGATNALTVLNNGNVGIGTTSPASLLSVGPSSQFQVNASGNVTGGTYNTATVSGGSLTGGSISGGTLTATAVNGVTTANILTGISVASANGFTGTSSGGATPALTLGTSVTGIMQGNGTSVSAATTTGTGSVVLANSPVFTTPNIGSATGSISGNAATVTTDANLTGVVTSVGNATSIAAGAIGNSLLANSSITVNGTNVSVTGSPVALGGTLAVSLPQSVALSATPTFASQTLSATLNQLTLGTTNTTTISATAPAASRTYTIPDDATAGVNFVLAPTSTAATQALFASTTAGSPTYRSIVVTDLPSSVVTSVVNGTNVTGSISGQALTLGFTGQLAVASGGTGAASLTGLVKGSGTSPFTAAVAGTDYQVPLTFGSGLTNASNIVTNNLTSGVSGNQTVVGSTSANGTLTLQGNSATSGNTATNAAISLNVGNSGATTAMTVLNNGNVGVGTTSPSSLLSVGSSSQFQVNSSGAVAAGTWQGSSVGVQYGGTGNASETAYALLAGGTSSTGALQQVAGVGTTGQVLTSNGASALPTWQTVSGMVYPSSGIPNSTGSAWGTSYTTTGSGTVVALQTSPTFTTSISAPLLFGSSSANGTLTLEGNSATSGNTATNAAISLNVGNSGATNALTVLNNGDVGIGTSAPGAQLSVVSTSQQLNLGYDTSNYWGGTISSSGSLTFTGSGTSPQFQVSSSTASVTDNFADQSEIATSSSIVVSSGSLQLSSAPCGSFTVTDSHGLTYGTVLGADGNCWLDRNIGATRVATSATDSSSYGYLYEWGRLSDGHELLSSGTTTTLASSSTPGNSLAIFGTAGYPYDWLSTQNNALWQGVSGVNNPCPAGFAVPSNAQWSSLVTAAGITNSVTAYSSSLKLTMTGYRSSFGFSNVGTQGNYWSSDTSTPWAEAFLFSASSSSAATGIPAGRTNLYSVRCIEN